MTQQMAGQNSANQLDILLDDVSPLMRIEGACVLEAWQAGDREFVGMSMQALAGYIYSRMKSAQQRELANQRKRRSKEEHRGRLGEKTKRERQSAQ